VRRLARTSWIAIILIGIAWSFACLLAMGVDVSQLLSSAQTTNVEASGWVTVVGFSMSPTGALLVFGPPVALIVLRVFASRIHPRR
jgi:hypothetical protein